MKIHADREMCIGAGMCVLTAPDVFDQDDEEGRVVVIEVEPSAEHQAAAQEAVALCPSGAISIAQD
ncbi:MAG: ferredoxin [Stackebrandtia sp.]